MHLVRLVMADKAFSVSSPKIWNKPSFNYHAARDVRPRGLASVSRPNSNGLGLGLLGLGLGLGLGHQSSASS